MKVSANCEWRVFGEIHDEVRRKIMSLRPRIESVTSLRDEYLWYPGCVANVKLRKAKLKFKRRVHTTSDGLEVWTIRAKVPIDPEGIEILEHELKASAPKGIETSCKSPQDLREALSRFDPPLFCITVTKFRRQFLRVLNGHTVSVELAEIKAPVQTGSICIECEGVDPDKVPSSVFDTLRAVRDEIGLPGGMRVKNYLEVLEMWAGQ